MIKNILKKIFDLRDGEINIALFMQGYIFLIIATLLIIKPTINALFIYEVGVENLPYAYLLVAMTAVGTSYFYSKISESYPLKIIIKTTLLISVGSLLLLGVLLHLGFVPVWVLYFFYIAVAIYAVLTTSQFWVLANMVFNIREAKRLFGFVGAGAIVGGIFGGYLTTILAPFIGNENLIFVACFFLMLCLPLVSYIWKIKIVPLNSFKQKKRAGISKNNPLKLILASQHLKYLAVIIGVSVIIAKLVDYQFSYIASKKIEDTDELTAFFGFWLSSFNVISLLLQLFITRKIVGVWGVGYALLLLPLLLFLGGVLFIIFPELGVVIVLRGIDASLKQSVHKSAVELIALPLPFQLKKKTKSFIDVVVDSVATGIAGCLLIFFIKGLEVKPQYIMFLIMTLTLVWLYFVLKIRQQYFLSFRKNLEIILAPQKTKKTTVSKESFLKGMRRVFKEGNTQEILFMLQKALEIKDARLKEDILPLLSHSSNEVKVAALHNLFYINNAVVHLEVIPLLQEKDRALVVAALDYLLLHADKEETIVFDYYLDNKDPFIASAALYCLAKESRDNTKLKKKYGLSTRIDAYIASQNQPHLSTAGLLALIETIGMADYQKGYALLHNSLHHQEDSVKKAAIAAAGNTLNEQFINPLLHLLPHKNCRDAVIQALLFYDTSIIKVLEHKLKDSDVDIAIRQLIPKTIAAFKSQEAVDSLITSFINAQELSIRLACVAFLSELKRELPSLRFNQTLIAKLIFEECKLYNNTINAMHTQIIVHYIRRKKVKIPDDEMKARETLLNLLEKRLDYGLSSIFKLLELKYPQKDVKLAYEGITSNQKEDVTNAIEFLEILLNPNLKQALIPIVEATILDTTSDEVIDAISKNRMTEFECFESILQGKDAKLKMAVLYLIKETKNKHYLPLVTPLINNQNKNIQSLANTVKDSFL